MVAKQQVSTLLYSYKEKKLCVAVRPLPLPIDRQLGGNSLQRRDQLGVSI
jgi:hypothetical protein